MARSAADWLQEANTLSQRVLSVDAREAWAKVRAGEYEGTPFAEELWQLMYLAGEYRPTALAAE